MRWPLLLLLFAAPQVNAGKPTSALIVEMGERHGEVEPCGCPRVQLGGLSRLVNFVDRRTKAAKGSAVLIVDTGNSFFSLPVLPDTRLESEKRKADLIADAYKLLGVQVLVPGPKDLALGPAELDRLAQRAGLKLLSPGSHAVVEHGGVKVGWMGIGEPPAPEVLKGALAAMAGADVKIAVSQTPDGADAARAAGFDLVISAPQPEGKSVHWGTWDLAGKTWKDKTETELDPQWEKGGRFEKTYRRYLSSMKSAAVRQVPIKTTKKSERGPFKAQALECRKCHIKQYDFWAETQHASAYLVLFAKDQNFNPECIACHSLGFQQAGGFSDITAPITLKGQPPRAKGETPFVEKWMKEIFAGDPGQGDLDSRKQPQRYAELKKRYHVAVDKLHADGKLQSLHMGVQCEHCHGNRNGHRTSPEFKTIGKVTAGRCTDCHTPPHDESFNFAQRVQAVACPPMER